MNKETLQVCPFRNVECSLFQNNQLSSDEEKCPLGIVDKSLSTGKACAFKIIGIYALRAIQELIVKEKLDKV